MQAEGGGEQVFTCRERCPKKIERLGRGKGKVSSREIAAVISELRREGHRLGDLLRSVGMKRGTFYYQLRALEKGDKYARVKGRIAEIYNESRGTYGYRRVAMALALDGDVLDEKTVYRLMCQMGLQSVMRKKRYRRQGKEECAAAPNILGRDFSATAPLTRLATDVSEVTIKDRTIYLSPILDLYNGEIVAHDISPSADTDMVTRMLDMLFERGGAKEGIIIHSDQGILYKSRRYRGALERHGIVQSMSRKGNCYDNAVMENFFGMMKSELLYTRKFKDINEFEAELEKYIHYYNNDRIKLRLGTSPVKYRLEHA